MFKGTVKTVHEYGCLVELLRNQQGLLHVSNMSSAVPAPAARDVVNVGDTVDVRVVEVDRYGKRDTIGACYDRGTSTIGVLRYFCDRGTLAIGVLLR